MRIFTIGYEGTTMADFLAALKEAGVRQLIDVRAVASSRRPGFSKTALRNSLAEEGIGYVHLRALGTPADGRAAARAGRLDDLKRIYAGQLELPKRSPKPRRWSHLRAKSRARCSATSVNRAAATGRSF
jgi:hypothetical protein